MRAVVFNRELSYQPNYPAPNPAEGECLVQVRLAGICATDLHLTRGYMDFSGVLGHEMVGTVLEGPTDWTGKRVVCEINHVCGQCKLCQSGLSNHCKNRTVMGIAGRDGCFADLVTVNQKNLHLVPDSVSDEEAVFVEPLAAAYQVLAQSFIDSRTSVSVVGAGRLGLLVAQVLATKGCNLTVVGRNPNKLLLCEKKGVQAIHVDELVARQDRDVVVECSGSPAGMKVAMELVRPRGTIILKSTCADNEALDLAPIVVNEISVVGSRCGPFGEALNALAREAIEVRSMISKTFPIEDAIKAFDAAADPRNIKTLLSMG